jgi:adenylate cyclase
LRYVFADYTLDIGRRELWRGTKIVRTTPQVFSLLHFLIHNRERVVSKDELIAAIWTQRIVSDAAVTTRLNAVRKAVGDSGREQRFIKTLPRKGFRFVAAVREELQRQMSVTVASSSKSSPSFFERPSLAVLPFTSAPDEPMAISLCQQLTEDLLLALTKLRWLLVTTNALNPCDGGELAPSYLLQSNLRQSRGRLGITSRLLDPATRHHIWASRYVQNSNQGLRVRAEFVRALVSDIARAILDAERQRALRSPTENLSAWQAYQRGMWHMSRCDAAQNKLARVHIQHALDLDPMCAAAYGALGWSHMMSASIFSEMTVTEGCLLAEPLIRKATMLDESDPQPRARLALSSLLQGDLEGAFQEAQEVLAVDGNCADALGVKGAALVYSGRPKEGRAAIRRYLALSPSDPARPIRISQIAASLYLEGDFENALLTAKRVVRQYPQHPIAYRWLAASLGRLGRTPEAEAALDELRTRWPSSFDMYVRQPPPSYCSIEYAPMLKGLRAAGWRN